jgi:REP element-mobilizing transposase RayT
MARSRESIIGHHLIWTLYGHWLSNDLRGSGSDELRQEKFADLGPIHHGRKPEHEQPSRKELCAFYKEAEPLLDYPRFWLDAAKRQAVGACIGDLVKQKSYTVWACAVLSNHIHLVIRRHRDDALRMWHTFANAIRLRLREFSEIDDRHPVLSDRPYKVFLRNPHEVRTRVVYVERNPEKEGLRPQHWDFVIEYNNWPFHKKL